MNILQKTAILSLSFISLIATAAMAPALNGIQAHFMYAPTTLVKLVVTLPALICIPVGLLNNAFMKFVSKKNLILIGLLLFAIGGLSSFISTSIYMLLFTKVILGVGLGITAPLSLVLIGDFFYGSERAKFLGFATATTNLGGIVSTLCVGFLAGFGWRYPFLVYGIAIIVIAIIVLFLPKIPAKDEYNNLDVKNIEEDIKLNKGIFKYAGLVLLALVAFYAVPTDMDFLMKFKNLGTASTAANIVSLSTFSSLISAMLFPMIMRHLGKFYSIVIFILMTLGFLLLGFSPNMFMIIVGIILVGFGFGSIVPLGMLFASNLVHKTHTALAILIVSSALYLGEFSSPLILEQISKILDIKNATGALFAAAAVCVIAILLAIYSAISDKNIIKQFNKNN